MAKIKIIAAIGKNKELGKNNDLIWHLKEDLKFFKETTNGHKIVMGYNTYLSLPKKLANREYIILTSKNIEVDGAQIYHDLESLLTYLNALEEDIYIIGGASVYKLFINLADELILTEIDSESEADVYFPKWNEEDYQRQIISEIEEDVTYKHVRYRRK